MPQKAGIARAPCSAALATTTAAGPLVAALAAPAAADRGHDPARGPRRRGSRSAATAGACPTSRARSRARPVVRAGLLPGAGPALAARPLPARGARPAVRDRRARRAWRRTASCARSACAASGCARRRSSTAELRDQIAAMAARDQRRRRGAPRRRRSSCRSCASSSSRGRPPTRLAMQKLLSFGLSTNWERELLRADLARELGPELAARLDPAYPPANPVVLTPGVPRRRRDRARRAGRLDPPLPGDDGRGDRLEQLGRRALALGHRTAR